MSLLVPADPKHKATKEMFLKNKELLIEINDVTNQDLYEFVDLRKIDDLVLYYYYYEETRDGATGSSINMKAFKREADGLVMLGKGCAMVVSGIMNKNERFALIESDACLSNPIAYWEDEAKQKKVQK